MQKPAGFDQAAASLNYEPLKLGGHVCTILDLEETVSKTNKDMFKVALDIAAPDPQAGYYKRRFDADSREQKKWPCIMYVVVTDNEGNCSRSCASFVTSVEESNPGFAFPWDTPATFLPGKKVGVVFGEEEYKAKDGSIKKAVKPFWFRDAHKVAEAPVPRVKEYRPASGGGYGFTDIDPSEIPFFQ